MPNSRRRKFSVQNDVTRKNPTKGATMGTSSNSSSNPFQKASKTVNNKSYPNRSLGVEPMAVVLECEECSSASLVKKEDKRADLGSLTPHSLCTSTHSVSAESTRSIPPLTPRPSKPDKMDRNRREPPRQHRARVRSPKHSLVVLKSQIKEIEFHNSVDLSSTRLQSSRTSIDSISLEPAQPIPPLTPRSSKPETMDRREQPRHHRPRVRSPKHSLLVLETPKTPSIEIHKFEDIGTCVDIGIDSCMVTVGTNVIDWAQEARDWAQDMQVYTANAVELEALEYEQSSDHSLDDMCRICHSGNSSSQELGRLVSACNCRGTVGRVHVRCLERWLTESGKSRCELCGTRYHTRRVHRYGVLKALVMWFLSQNAKQLMVDSLGIMLMSPLAVLAAWLSGRTLASLMAQENQLTPWPLASTFVLACMTLVCYYCWIVSAATRHALGWWIWYRSQYEVRLELQEEE